MYKLLITLFFALSVSTVIAEDRELAKLFAAHGVDGTMVISSLNDEQRFVHNDDRANHQFTTASTFKVLNALISLEEKAISGKAAILKWNGHIYEYAPWNNDQTLASAFKVSCVWCFQELARRVGSKKYRNYIRNLSYGKLNEPFNETTFWLDGSLKISAIEQIDFLKKVHLRSLPFKAHSFNTLQEIMLVENATNFTLRAKTGWAVQAKPQLGWYVGYIETKEDVWFFATNIKINSKKDLPLRQKLTREALVVKGIIKDRS